MSQPEQSKQGVQRNDDHRNHFNWCRFEELKAEHFEPWNRILLLGNLLSVWIRVVRLIRLQIHEPPHDNTIDKWNGDESLELIDNEAVQKGGENHSWSSILCNNNKVTKALKEDVSVHHHDNELEGQDLATLTCLFLVGLYLDKVNAEYLKYELHWIGKTNSQYTFPYEYFDVAPSKLFSVDCLLALIFLKETE